MVRFCFRFTSFIFLVAGCFPVLASPPVRIVATVGMIADIVRQVTGENTEVVTLIGEGVDPHMYKPTRHDIIELSRADMIFYNGLFLEGKMAELLGRLSRQGRRAYAVSEWLAAEDLLASPEYHRRHDPHIWMDVRLWSRAVDLMADRLIAFQPDHEEAIRKRAALLVADLGQLNRYIMEIMETVPASRRVLITAHDAFHYFGRAYGLEVLGIQGISTESEAGLNDINRLVDVIVQRDIRAIFVETSVASRNVYALIEGARARGHEVTIGGHLFSDAMGRPGTYEGTYIGMLDHNATTIARALGGQVPAGGFRAWKEKNTP